MMFVLAAGRMKTPLPGQARVNTLTKSDQGDTGTDIILTALLFYFNCYFRQTLRRVVNLSFRRRLSFLCLEAHTSISVIALESGRSIWIQVDNNYNIQHGKQGCRSYWTTNSSTSCTNTRKLEVR